MADKLTLRGIKRIEKYVAPADPADREFSLKRPTTGKDQFTLKRWWTERGNRNPKRYINATCLDIANFRGTAAVLAVVSSQDTRLDIILNDAQDTLTFGDTHAVERIAVFSADLSTLHYDYVIPRIAGGKVATLTVSAISTAKTIGTVSLTGIPATANGNIATGNLSYNTVGETADNSQYTFAWTGTGGVSFSAATAATTTATWPASTTGNQTVTLTISTAEANVTPNSVATQSSNIALTATGGIATVDTFGTTTAFTASQSGAACTLGAPGLGGGTTAQGTFDSDGSGDITDITITTAGTNYVVGETVSVTETGGTPGVGSFRVASIS